MNLRALRTLVEIDRVGSFALTAERLGQTLPAVSTQMKALERELNIALFDRAHRPPMMTPIARTVVEHAKRILVEVDAIQSIQLRDDVLQGVIRIGFVSTASVRLMPGFLSRARALHPNVRFEVETGLSTDLIAAVLAARLDTAVVTEMPRLPAQTSFRALLSEPFVLAVPKSARRWTLERCARELTQIQFAPETGIGLLAEQHLKDRALAPSSRLEMDSVEAVMGCVNAGVGFALLPRPDAERYAVDAVIRSNLAPPFERRLGLVTRQSSMLHGQIETVAALF